MADPATAPLDPARLADLDDAALYQLLHAVQDEVAARNEDGFAALVREVIDAMQLDATSPPARVAWPVSEWENGWFYNDCAGVITLADGAVLTDIDFSGTLVADRLTELSGDAQPLGSGAGLVVDLGSGRVDHEPVLRGLNH